MTDNHDTDRPRIDGPRIRPLDETPGLNLDRPPSARVEQEERNRLTQERASDERLAVEVARTNQSVRAAQEARTALYGAQETDGLAPGERHPSPELPAGELGDAIRGLLRLERIEGALSRALARLDEERLSHAQDSERGWEAAAEAVAWEAVRAGMRKEAVPPICGPVFDALTQQADAALFTYRHFERIQRFIEAKAVIQAPAAMAKAWEEAEEAVNTAACEALDKAQDAVAELAEHDLTVDSDLASVVDSGSEEALAAMRAWRGALAHWEAVQQVRVWWTSAIVRGFEFDRAGHIRVVPPPRIPSGPHARQGSIDKAKSQHVEERVQASTFTYWQGTEDGGYLEDGMPMQPPQGSHARMPIQAARTPEGSLKWSAYSRCTVPGIEVRPGTIDRITLGWTEDALTNEEEK